MLVSPTFPYIILLLFASGGVLNESICTVANRNQQPKPTLMPLPSQPEPCDSSRETAVLRSPRRCPGYSINTARGTATCSTGWAPVIQTGGQAAVQGCSGCRSPLKWIKHPDPSRQHQTLFFPPFNQWQVWLRQEACFFSILSERYKKKSSEIVWSTLEIHYLSRVILFSWFIFCLIVFNFGSSKNTEQYEK